MIKLLLGVSNNKMKIYFNIIFHLYCSKLKTWNSVNHSIIVQIFLLYIAVQHERGPRNSTIRRQVAMYLKETRDYGALVAQSPFRPPYLTGCYGIEQMADAFAMSPLEPQSPVSPLSPGMICQPTPKVRVLKFLCSAIIRTNQVNVENSNTNYTCIYHVL